jgi:hypothetical protein
VVGISIVVGAGRVPVDGVGNGLGTAPVEAHADAKHATATADHFVTS